MLPPWHELSSRLLAVAALLLPAAAVLAAPQQPAAQDLRYDRDVRPILADRCSRCHGPRAGAAAAETPGRHLYGQYAFTPAGLGPANLGTTRACDIELKY